MLTIAAQVLADGVWTVNPEEPASLALALVGVGTVAAYGLLAGRIGHAEAAPATKTNPLRKQTKRTKTSPNRRHRRAA